MSNDYRGRDYYIITAVICCSAVYFLSSLRYGINLLDEGYLLDPITRILAGQTPYKDFIHQYPPGRFYFFALLFRIFEPGILLTRVVWITVIITSLVLMYLLGTKIMSRGYAVIPPLLYLLAPGPWQKSLFVFFVLLNALVAASLATGCYSKGRIIRIGVLAGVTFLFRQDVGVYALITYTAALLLSDSSPKDGLRALAFLGAGAFLPVLSASIFFFSQGALVDFVSQVLFAGAEGARKNSLPFPPLLPLLPRSLADLFEIPGRLAFYLPPVIMVATATYAVAGIRIRGRFDNTRKILLVLVIMAFLAFRLNLLRTHVLHLFQVVPVPSIMFVFLVYRFINRLDKAGDRVLVILARFTFAALILSSGLFLLKLGHFQFPNSIMVRIRQDTPVKVGKDTLYLNRFRAENISRVTAYVEKTVEKGEPILCIPDIPIFYFMTGRPNPTRFELFRPGRFKDESSQMDVIRALEEAQVRLVIFNLEQIDDGRLQRRMGAHAPLITDYLVRNFVPAARFGAFQILERAAPLPVPRNIILITVDTLRFDHLNPYGYRLPTSPRISELASESLLFQRAYTPVPKTLPATASMMTGAPPGETGVRYNGDNLETERATIAETMKQAGFRTVGIVSSPLLTAGSGFERGFDVYDDKLDEPVPPAGFRERNASRTTEAACSAIEAEAAAGKRFFAWIHYMDPHGPYSPPPGSDSLFYDGPGRMLPDNLIPDYQRIEGVRSSGRYRALYDAEISTVDAAIGDFLDFLGERDLFDESLIILTADHGEGLGEHGYYYEHGACLYEHQVRVPLLVKFPGSRLSGGIVLPTVSLLDIFPTINWCVDAASLSDPGFGTNLFALAMLKERSSHDIFLESDNTAFGGNEKIFGMVRNGEWKLIKHPDNSLELYDLSIDKGEQFNIAGECRKEKKSMLEAMALAGY